MSERMTSVTVAGAKPGSGFADYGRRDVNEMIVRLRRIAAEQKADAELILAASVEDFIVETYVGIHVQRNREQLWPRDEKAL